MHSLPFQSRRCAAGSFGAGGSFSIRSSPLATRSNTRKSFRIRTRCSGQAPLRIIVGGGPAMLTVDELRQKAEAYAYQRDGMLLKDFEQWFEDNSIDADDNAEVKELRIAIDAAFAGYHFDRIGEAALREELVAAI